VKAHKTSGGRKMPVRHTIPLGIVIFLVCYYPTTATTLLSTDVIANRKVSLLNKTHPPTQSYCSTHKKNNNVGLLGTVIGLLLSESKAKIQRRLFCQLLHNRIFGYTPGVEGGGRPKVTLHTLQAL